MKVHVDGQGIGGTADHGTEFVGNNGRLVVDRGGWIIFDNSSKPQEKPTTGRGTDHQQNWLDAVKSRNITSLRSPISSMAQTTNVCHLSNVAMLAGKELTWDNAKQEITDRDAKQLLPYQCPYRKPWSLPSKV